MNEKVPGQRSAASIRPGSNGMEWSHPDAPEL